MLEELKTESQCLKIRPYTPGVKNNTENPLAIACSGGGGHIVAIKAILSWYQQQGLTLHQPAPYRKQTKTLMGASIALASRANAVSGIKKLTGITGLPVLPLKKDMKRAVGELQEINTSPRFYVDMLLDVFPGGYEFAAIWNINQRQDNKRELMKLVNLQPVNDQLYFKKISEFFLKKLNAAHAEGRPFTEIISTQAMGLAGLCHAVQRYNFRHGSSLAINIFMTDLPTMGAVHYFRALARLTPEYQRLINLYAVGLNQDVINHFFKRGSHFQGLYNINPKQNPMIRAGYVPDLSLLNEEKIATVMLGSQASDDTEKYVDGLFQFGMDKIIVFYGTNHALRDRIAKKYHDSTDRVVLLSSVDDGYLATLMAESDILITRTGGLGTMMLMALEHRQDQIIMIHHADSNKKARHSGSGIPWEDHNADGLIHALNNRVIKTCPSEFLGYL